MHTAGSEAETVVMSFIYGTYIHTYYLHTYYMHTTTVVMSLIDVTHMHAYIHTLHTTYTYTHTHTHTHTTTAVMSLIEGVELMARRYKLSGLFK